MTPSYPPAAPPSRIDAVDGLRGLAVLGILTVNITGFWGPALASYTPRLPTFDPGAEGWFAFVFLVFEGKMRALFTLLFGASLVLFCEAAERRGDDADVLQVRRLLWLMAFGYLHYALLWWGDILFPYGLLGLAALALRRVPPVPLAAGGLVLFVVPHAAGALLGLTDALAAPPDDGGNARFVARSLAHDIAVLDAPFIEAVRLRLSAQPFLPLSTTLATMMETLPLMLLGMAAVRGGFFTGGWSRAALVRLAVLGIATGGTMTAAMLAWMWPRHFPLSPMVLAMNDAAALPHLLMAAGYTAAFVLAWPRLATTFAGRTLGAAGRCAFSNYIGTTVLMTAIFSGWGLGLGPELPRAWLPLFVLLGWAAMLAWSAWWLSRHRQGPLEAAWRRLARTGGR